MDATSNSSISDKTNKTMMLTKLMRPNPSRSTKSYREFVVLIRILVFTTAADNGGFLGFDLLLFWL